MTADELFSMSVIDAGLEVAQFLQQHVDFTYADAIRYLSHVPARSASLDFRKASAVAETMGWCVFVTNGNRQTSLRCTIMELVKKSKPFWSRVGHLGRQNVVRMLTQNQRQCFEAAGLLGDFCNPDIQGWWVDLAQFSRHEENQRLVEAGRAGELRTLRYESARLARLGVDRQPRLVSLEDQAAGYDVLSFDLLENQTIAELQIEVKSSAFEPLHFYLSRNEWEVAVASSRPHVFHLWGPDSESPIVLTVDSLVAHIPSDRGNGEWEKLHIYLAPVHSD